MLNNIKKLRLERGLTQKELAGMIPTTPPTLTRWENSTRPISSKWLFKVARALGVTVSDLFGEKDAPKAIKSAEGAVTESIIGVIVPAIYDATKGKLDAKKELPQLINHFFGLFFDMYQADPSAWRMPSEKQVAAMVKKHLAQ